MFLWLHPFLPNSCVSGLGVFGVPKCFLLCVQASSGCLEEELCVPGIACSHAMCDSSTVALLSDVSLPMNLMLVSTCV